MSEKLEVVFLGTGTSQGIPVLGNNHPVCKSTNLKDKRLRSSLLLSWGGHNYVIDCGPDFRQQMLRAGCELLHGILLTHEHNDHTAGLDDIRPYNFKQGTVPVYAHRRVINAVRQRFDYIFVTEDKYPGAPTIELMEISEEKPFRLGGKTVIPIPVMHGNMPVLGFRIDDFTYITDAKTIGAEAVKKITGTDTLVINALREKPHHSHFNLEDALAFVEEIQPKKAYLTHISHLLGFHDEVQERLPEGVFLAYDGLRVAITKSPNL